jgi:diketogulonate reductase-like aldo/keto reductase
LSDRQIRYGIFIEGNSIDGAKKAAVKKEIRKVDRRRIQFNLLVFDVVPPGVGRGTAAGTPALPLWELCVDSSRRMLLRAALATALAAIPLLPRAKAQRHAPITRPIPSTGEPLPVIGLGSWITFNVGADPVLRDECTAIMGAFFETGGGMIDCSPMYGSSQSTIGHGLRKLGYPPPLFSAEKVWTSRAGNGPRQIEQTRAQWGVERFDLLQVHNLVSWERHLETLFAMKAEEKLRYVGITTSEGRRHDEIEHIMASRPIDFVQVTYNVLDREAEARILPLAQERGIAVIVNRPFRQGALTRDLEEHPLPEWVAAAGVSSWAQFILKFIISHPAVSCVIPATTRVDHLRENMAAGSGPLPDETLRRRMAEHVRQL